MIMININLLLFYLLLSIIYYNYHNDKLIIYIDIYMINDNDKFIMININLLSLL